MQLRLPSTVSLIAGLLVANVCIAGQLAVPDGTRDANVAALCCLLYSDEWEAFWRTDAA